MNWSIEIRIKRCKNGFYIRIYDGFWKYLPKRFIAKDNVELSDIIQEFVTNFEKLQEKGG